MPVKTLILATIIAHLVLPAAAAGNAEAGRQLVLRSCASCHTLAANKAATDTAPPLSFLSKDNKTRPAWVRGWLMDPHPPMPNIMLNRAQIDNIIAYLNTLPTD
jgi:cytochrome c